MKQRTEEEADEDSPTSPPAEYRDTLTGRVYLQLANLIKSGEYKPNTRLPGEHALAEYYGVSRPIVRRALDLLRQDGLISSRQGAGSFVRDHEAPAPTLTFTRAETVPDIQRCYEYRLAIEPDAAYWAALRRGDSSIARLTSALEVLRGVPRRRQYHAEADFAFHHIIVRASNNHYFVTSYEALRPSIAVAMKVHGYAVMWPEEERDSVFHEHQRIYDAIIAGDADKARVEMREHIEDSRMRMFEGRQLDLSERE